MFIINKNINHLIVLTAITCLSSNAIAQGIHFSQFFNAPSLINPAYTGMLPEDDFRVGVQYRNQAQTIPVPYNTASAFADFVVGRGEDKNAWFGIGASFYNDVAGAAKLTLNKPKINVAYHFVPGDNNMLSFGASVGFASRRANLSALTFNSQWDEFSFNNDLPSGEQIVQGRSNYIDVQTGVSFQHFDQEKIYYRVGASVMHLNQPKETFLSGSNRLGMRPVVDAVFSYKSSPTTMWSPSAYYTFQKSASELVVGAMLNKSTNGGVALNSQRAEVLAGVYYRLKDALILMGGYQWKNTQFLVSYDQTLSGLAVANSGFGAIEFSIIYTGRYQGGGSPRRYLGCPRL